MPNSPHDSSPAALSEDECRSACLPALAAAVLCLLIYGITLPPTVTGDDSGELVVAAYRLGIPHPHGYPLWCLLAHPFTWLPFGSVAWRVALSSAVYAAAAVFLLGLLLRRFTQSKWAVFVGAACLGVSREFWEQAVIAEAYALNMLLILACVLVLYRWRESSQSAALPNPPGTANDRWLYAFALLYGLSLGNHYTMVLLGPVFAVFILSYDDWAWRRWRVYGGMVCLAALSMFLVFCYLPLRSMADPAMDWGNPETLENWWDVVRRKQYAFMFSQYPRSLGDFTAQFVLFCRYWWTEFTPLGSVIGLIGLICLFTLPRKRVGEGIFLIALGLVVVLGFNVIQNPRMDREWQWVISVFYIPAYMVTALGIGIVIDRLRSLRHCRWIALLLGVLLILAPLRMHWRHCDKSSYHYTNRYARLLLDTLPENALYFPNSDHGAFPVLYSQEVDGYRRDVGLGRIYGYIETDLVPGLPEELRAELGEFPRRSQEGSYFEWMLAQTDRPVFFQKKPSLPADSSIRFHQHGVLFQALRPGEAASSIDPWPVLNRLRETPQTDDDTALLIHAEYHLALGEYALNSVTETEQVGLTFIEVAVAAYERDQRILNNAGTLCARYKQYEAARAYFEEALKQNPELESARANLERLNALTP